MATEAATHPSVRGKFIFLGTDKFHVKGVVYGAFTPRLDHT
jgi:hypothetical protein